MAGAQITIMERWPQLRGKYDLQWCHLLWRHTVIPDSRSFWSNLSGLPFHEERYTILGSVSMNRISSQIKQVGAFHFPLFLAIGRLGSWLMCRCREYLAGTMLLSRKIRIESIFIVGCVITDASTPSFRVMVPEYLFQSPEVLRRWSPQEWSFSLEFTKCLLLFLPLYPAGPILMIMVLTSLLPHNKITESY